MPEEKKPLPFAVGDMVRLKSGGSLMEVIRIDCRLPNCIYCVWIDEKNASHGSFFTAETLTTEVPHPPNRQGLSTVGSAGHAGE